MQERHNIYSTMLEIIETDHDYVIGGIYDSGLCDLLLEASGILDYEFKNFPEIAKHKPKDREEKYFLWWGKTKYGTEKRIRVLKLSKYETAVPLNNQKTTP